MLLSLFLLHFSHNPTYATILINEVYPHPDPTNTSDNEWIELINTDYSQSTTLIPPTLTGWTLWDTTSYPSLLFTFTSETAFQNQFFIIEINNKLNNSGDGVILKNNLGQIIDQMSYSSSQTNQSWARTTDNTGDFILTTPSKNHNNPFPENTPTPTPPSPTTLPTNTPTPTIYITQNSPILSEVMACPTENNEWIELYNPHQTTINLNNWSLHDAQGEIFTFTDQIINPTSYISVEINQKLNNNGDQIFLKNPIQETIVQMTYASCTKGSSWVWFGNIWQETLSPTKNTSNVLESEQISPTPALTLTPTPTSTTTSSSNIKNSQAPTSPQSQKKKKPTLLKNYPLPKYSNPLDLNNSSTKATYLNSPPRADHLIFNPTITQKNRLISVIMGGLTLVATGYYTLNNYNKI